MSYFTQISYADSGSLDAFTRLRVSNPDTLFSTQMQYTTEPLQMESFNTAAGVAPTWSANTRMVACQCTNTGTSGLQSFMYAPYHPGKSQFIAVTFVLGSGVAASTVDVGYFDANNGVILRQNGATNLQLILRTSTSGSVSDANIVAQSAWNIDKMDGTGASGITLDVTKAQILVIDLQFLGMGRVRVGFDIDGVLYYVHQFLNANSLTVPYMQTATLPVGFLVTSTGGSKTANFKCATVLSEGGSWDDQGFRFSTPEATVTAGNGTRTFMMSLRPKTTFNGISNRETCLLQAVNIAVTGNNAVKWELIVNATFSVAPTYADVSTTYSGYEYGTGGTFTNITSGVILQSGYCDSVSAVTAEIDRAVSIHCPITLDRAGAVRGLGTYYLFVTGTTNTSATRATMEFVEIR